MDWLAKLEEVTINWGKLTMVFRQGGKRVTIQGDPTLVGEVVELEALLKMKEVEAITLVWSLGQTEVNGRG